MKRSKNIWFIVSALFLVALVFCGKIFLANPSDENVLSEQIEKSESESEIELRAPISLFKSVSETDFIFIDDTIVAKRVCEVFPDSSWLKSALKAGDYVSLKLFDDVEFGGAISRVTKYVNGTTGFSVQTESGALFVSQRGADLSISLDLFNGESYSVFSEDGRYLGIEIDNDKSNFLNPSSVDIPSTSADQNQNHQPNTYSLNSPDNSEILRVIDLMILYTPSAETELGDVKLDLAIATAMTQANTAHANSGTGVYLNLVYSGPVDYSRGEKSCDEILYDLTEKSGEHSELDEVHDLRDEYGADLVCLLDDFNDTGGLAWLLNDSRGSADYAFSIVRAQQVDYVYTLVHELAHNMGCGHSKTQAVQSDPGIFPYSYGWQWKDFYQKSAYNRIGYCTIMTYEDFDSNGSWDYVRVPHFSNPSISYSSQAETNFTGHVKNGDNARTIRETSPVIANYRDAINPDYDADGLPNEWEQEHFGTDVGANPEKISENGVQTIFECYVSGIDPLDGNSIFASKIKRKNAVGNIVTWNAVPSRTYSISYSTNLMDKFNVIESEILYPQSSWTDSVERVNAFYKVGVSVE